MKKLKISIFILSTLLVGYRRWIAWSVCLSAIILLGALRTEMYADFTFGSLAILPVFLIAWIGGRKSGLFFACLTVAMWVVADIVSARQFSSPWIPWANAASRLMTYGLVALLTSQIRLQFEREHIHATRDALTGLLNRRAFFEEGAAEVEHLEREAHSLTVIFLDLDDFKQLNDTQGHDAGDAALRATAQALLGALPSSDRVARLGGDEFAALLPEIDYGTAIKAGQKIFTDVNTALKAFPPVTGSIGVAWFEEADRILPAMLKAADELMYEVKESGKNNMSSRRFAAMKKPDSESGVSK